MLLTWRLRRADRANEWQWPIARTLIRMVARILPLRHEGRIIDHADCLAYKLVAYSSDCENVLRVFGVCFEFLT